MYVALVTFPPVAAERDEEFRDWFAWSNTVLSDTPGLHSRRLLAPTEGGARYRAVVEHESRESFARMHDRPEREQVQARLLPLLAGAGSPQAETYDVVVGDSVEPAGHSCHGEQHGSAHHGSGGCCREAAEPATTS